MIDVLVATSSRINFSPSLEANFRLGKFKNGRLGTTDFPKVKGEAERVNFINSCNKENVCS